MPFHFCADELVAILAAVPFLGFAVQRVRAFFGNRRSSAV